MIFYSYYKLAYLTRFFLSDFSLIYYSTSFRFWAYRTLFVIVRMCSFLKSKYPLPLWSLSLGKLFWEVFWRAMLCTLLIYYFFAFIFFSCKSLAGSPDIYPTIDKCYCCEYYKASFALSNPDYSMTVLL